jgi:hypothetical protein
MHGLRRSPYPKVYEFAKERLGRRVWAIKGESAQGGNVIRLANQTTDIEKQSQFPANYDRRELCERCCPWSPAS